MYKLSAFGHVWHLGLEGSQINVSVHFQVFPFLDFHNFQPFWNKPHKETDMGLNVTWKEKSLGLTFIKWNVDLLRKAKESSIYWGSDIKEALAVNFICFFSSPNLMHMKNKQFKHVFERHFLLECNKYCSTFMINIESSFIHSMKYLFVCKQIRIDTLF